MTPGFLLFGFSPTSPEWPHPSRVSLHPLPCPHPPLTHTHTHTHTLHLMPINDSFMWLLSACSDVCPIDLSTLLQASQPPLAATPTPAPDPLSTGIQPSQGLPPMPSQPTVPSALLKLSWINWIFLGQCICHRECF